MVKVLKFSGAVALLSVISVLGYQQSRINGRTGGEVGLLASTAHAAASASQAPTVKTLQHRGVYYPGKVDFSPNEMRVVVSGARVPNGRPLTVYISFG